MKKILILITLLLTFVFYLMVFTSEKFVCSTAVDIPKIVHYMQKQDEELEFWLAPRRDNDIVLD